ncbi:MAG TPA: tetratricopeptide repeat protein [Kiritimatiellia bacterium]|nr:tetratricopeptide repeat protein [Kiritimatiellia bacterium]HPS06284.1 tetratricopeptide repeat protein [Kiritimatiellia bacterium]
MDFIKRTLFATPWHVIRFFVPFTALLPFAVYHLTVFTHVYPGLSALLTAAAADLCPQEDLSYPLFTLVSHWVAALPYATLPLRLNLFCAACGALAAACFYLLTARLVFSFACEDPGGSMAALPPRTRDADSDSDDDKADKEERGFAMNADGTLSIPASVKEHNRRVSHAAVLGGLGAASALAFGAPFWLASTRLYPYTFDLLLVFFIINLLISYDQRANLFTLFLGVFLLSACCVESPLFLLLLPVGGFFLLRAMILNGQATTYRVLFVVLVGLAGAVLAGFLLWQAASHCAAIPVPAPRPILRVYQATVLGELVRWIPSFGWSYVFVQVLFPSAIAFFIFSHSFRRRTLVLFLMQLVLLATLVPSLLNLRISPWGIARLTFTIPIFSYVIIALLTGLLIAVWHLMREIYEDKVDEELDYYEYRDNPFVCKIGFVLCWPLLLLTLIVPFRSFTDIDPQEGTFVDAVTEELYRELGPRDWLVNSRMLQHHLLIRAHRDGRQLHFIATDSESGVHDTARFRATIQKDTAFASNRHRLLNAADVSTASFLHEWLRHETNAFRRVVLFNAPELWRANGFTAVPSGLFLSGQPQSIPVNAADLLARHQSSVEALRPFLFPAAPDSIRFFATIRKNLRRQLALMANELGVLLAADGRKNEAADLLGQAEKLDPENISLLLNRHHLAADQNIRPDTIPEIEARLRALQQHVNTFTLDGAALQSASGTLINPDTLEYVRKNIWIKAVSFRNLTITAAHLRAAPLTTLRDKKRELYQTITKHIDRNDFEDADRQLNLLLDLDDKDRFALINKARIAIERSDLPEAGLWIDLAKENGAPAEDLLWHEAAIQILNGKLKEARTLLNQALPSAPGDIRLWGLLADILLRLGEYPELENRVYPAMRSAANKNEHYLLHMVRGYILKHNGPRDYPAARASFLRALALNTHLGAVREDLLRIDDTLDVPAFCEEDAKEVLRRDPEHAFANFLFGTVRLRRGELDLAEDLFKRSLEKERNAPAFAGLGAVLLERGDFATAEKFLRRSLEMDNTRLFTWHMLARLLLATDRLDEATRALNTVLAGLPENLDVRLTLIRLLMKQKKFEEAALLVSSLLEDEDQLPHHVLSQLKPLAAQLSEALSK